MRKDLENTKLRLEVCTQMRYAPNPLSCANSGSHHILRALEEAVSTNNFSVDVVATKCLLMCEEGPNVRLQPKGIVWNRVSINALNEIIAKCK